MKQYSFSALVARQKYITRWGLMRCSRTETLAEHTADTAQLSYLLGCIALSQGQTVDPAKIAAAALFHDAGEILTGDLPTPVKYKNETLKNAYKALEKTAEESLLAMLPDEVSQRMASAVTGAELCQREKNLLKAADKLSALIKCIEERQSGNQEFASAEAAQRQSLTQMQLPEVEYFITFMLPEYEKTLDELTNGAF